MAGNDDLSAITSLLLRATTGNASELPRALLELGVRVASAAIALAANDDASASPLGGLLGRHRWALEAGLRVLAAWAGLWVSGEPRARRASRKAVLYAAVVPLAVADGLRRGYAGNA